MIALSAIIPLYLSASAVEVVTFPLHYSEERDVYIVPARYPEFRKIEVAAGTFREFFEAQVVDRTHRYFFEGSMHEYDERISVTYSAADGRAYLWREGLREVIFGSWRVAATGHADPTAAYEVCYEFYGEDTGRREECTSSAQYFNAPSAADVRPGDYYRLASGVIPPAPIADDWTDLPTYEEALDAAMERRQP